MGVITYNPLVCHEGIILLFSGMSQYWCTALLYIQYVGYVKLYVIFDY